MKSTSAQWLLWAITMSILLWLTLSGRFDWLAVALVASSLIWYMVVPRAASR